MTIAMLLMIAAPAQGVASEPMVATPDDAKAMRLHIGRTGIDTIRDERGALKAPPLDGR